MVERVLNRSLLGRLTRRTLVVCLAVALTALVTAGASPASPASCGTTTPPPNTAGCQITSGPMPVGDGTSTLGVSVSISPSPTPPYGDCVGPNGDQNGHFPCVLSHSHPATMLSAGASNTDPNGDSYVSFTPNGSCYGGQGCSGTVRYQSQGPATVRGVVVSATYQYGTCAL